MRQTGYWRILGIVPLLMLAGCGGSGPELAPVSGSVTLDGQPLARAQLRFQPEGGDSSPSYGTTDQNGRYELSYKRGQKGARIGWHSIFIDMNKGSGDGAGGPRPKSLPARYNTKTALREEVKSSGSNVFDFKLTSDEK